jgi:NHL repeat/WD40-like Beta Propeller Repeat
LCALAVITCFACVSASASAASPNLFWKVPEDGQPGSEAGRFLRPAGLATDPDTGHVFTADTGNARIVEMTAWGEFVKAWGWGVVASGPGNEPPKNEQQELTVDAEGGSYKLTFFNVYRAGEQIEQTTGPIFYNWPASDPGTPGVVDSVEEAIEALPSFQSLPGSVNITGGPGDAGGTSPYLIEFVGGYADKDVPPLAVTEPTLTGGAAEATVATAQVGGSFEICVPADGDVCQAGQAGGNSPGELPEALGGVALDDDANVYVYNTVLENRGEGPSFRVQKFSAAGEFLAMWGGEVNKTKSAEGGSTEAERNLCTKAQVETGDVCGTGVPGSGEGQFERTFAVGNRIAVGPDGAIYVGDDERIQKFTAAGAFVEDIEVAGEYVLNLAIDASGAFYVTYEISPSNMKDDVRKLVASGGVASEVTLFPADNPGTIALDGSGNVYIVDRRDAPDNFPKVIAYEPDGTVLIPFEEHLAESGRSLLGLATSEACGIPGIDLFVSDAGGFVSAYGSAPADIAACPPPEIPPTISRQFATAATDTTASVEARINPQFWPDTRYYVEYGTGTCAAGGCDSTQPLPPGLLLTSQVVKQILPTEAIDLSGLAPGTTYNFRFVAESTGGGPAYGIDPDGAGPEEASFEQGREGTFTTRPTDGATGDPCPNAPFRIGAAKRLPDCRAYEMVTPVDKENGDIIVLEKGGVIHAPLSLNQSSPDGNRLTYSSYRAFADATSAPITSTYLTSRSDTGWTSHGISPPRGRNTWEIVTTIDTQFKAFSPDLCDSWLVSETDPPLTSGATAGYANLYHRDNCGSGAGAYTALIPAADEAVQPKDFRPELQGVADDGEHSLVRVRGRVTDDAIACTVPGDATSCRLQLYKWLPGGELRFVCLLPGGTPAPNGCSAGSASGEISTDGRSQMVNNAISSDGSRVFWSDAAEKVGKIYVQIDGGPSVAVSAAGEALSGEVVSQYWTAASDGSRAIYSAGGEAELKKGVTDLYEFTVDGGVTDRIAGKVYGLLGASEDAKRIYLVSGEDLDAGAIENKPNLYLYEDEGEDFTFIGTLSQSDAEPKNTFSPVNLVPRNHSAQVSADGESAAFTSTASLTGFDNTDAESGEPALEVFHYDAAAEELRCVSCNPTGVLPSARNVGGNPPLYAAAVIPFTQTQIYQAPRALSEDGGRLYFESFENLSSADTNNKKDVYQWEAVGQGPEPGTCENSSPSYDAQAGGCVSLISTGQSHEDSSLVDISANGDDVFFATAESLLPQDPALVDIYDARVLGGFPAAPAPKAPCQGEACQSPAPPAPSSTTPSSSSFVGPGNPASKPAGRRCPKGKHKVKIKGKKRCVKNRKGKKKASRGDRNGRAGR